MIHFLIVVAFFFVLYHIGRILLRTVFKWVFIFVAAMALSAALHVLFNGLPK